MPFSQSLPADSAGRLVRWRSGTTAAPSTAHSTTIRASVGVCIGSPSRVMRRSEVGSHFPFFGVPETAERNYGSNNLQGRYRFDVRRSWQLGEVGYVPFWHGRAGPASYSVSPPFEVKRLCVGRNQTVSECTCHRLVRIHTNRPCNFRTSRKECAVRTPARVASP